MQQLKGREPKLLQKAAELEAELADWANRQLDLPDGYKVSVTLDLVRSDGKSTSGSAIEFGGHALRDSVERRYSATELKRVLKAEGTRSLFGRALAHLNAKRSNYGVLKPDSLDRSFGSGEIARWNRKFYAHNSTLRFALIEEGGPIGFRMNKGTYRLGTLKQH